VSRGIHDSDAAFEIVARAVERGRVTREAVEEALRATRGGASGLLDALGLDARAQDELAAAGEGESVPSDVARASEDPARRIGRYVVVEELEPGGMSRVYRAWDPALRRSVALKLPLAAPDARARDALVREARLAAALDHPSIAKVYETGEHEGAPFIALQFIEGRTLREAQATLSPCEAARVWREVTAAVAYAHRHGIVHRDLKPGNVMLDGAGRALVLDFGLAREVSSVASAFTTGLLAGTPSYMAPEQVMGHADARTDLYAIGASLYEGLAGRPPFPGATPTEVLARILRDDPVPLRVRVPELPEDLEAIVQKCLEKDPRRRYSDAAALIEDLDAFLSGHPLRHARRRTIGYVLARSARRDPLAWALGAAAALSLVAGSVFGVVNLFARDRALRDQVVAEARRARAERLLGARDATTLAELRAARLLELRDKEDARDASVLRAAALLSGDAAALGSQLAAIEPASDAERVEREALARRARDARRSGETIALLAAGRLAGSHGPRVLGHVPEVSGAAFSPDGRFLAASLDHVVAVWDRTSGAVVAVLAGATGLDGPCGFSPDGQVVAAGSQDGLVRLWDRETGKVRLELRGHTGPVRGLAFAPDGGELVSSSDDGTVRVWNPETGALVRSLGGGSEPVFAVAVAASRIAAAGGGAVRLWDRRTGELVGTVELGVPVRAVALSPDGRVLAVGAARALLTFEAASGHALARRESASGVWACAFLPDGRTIALGTHDGDLELADAQGVAPGRRLERPRTPVSWIACSPDGAELLVVSAEAATLERLSVAEGLVSARLGGRASPTTSCAFSPDGARVAAGFRGGEARVYDRATGRTLSAFAARGSVLSVAWSPDGREVAAGTAAGTVELHEPGGDPTPIVLEGHTGAVVAVTYAPSGRELASGSWDGTVGVWDLARRTLARRLPHGGRVQGIVYAASGKSLVSASSDKTIAVRDAATGKELLAIRDDRWPFSGVAVSPNGSDIASIDPSGRLRFWDAANGSLRAATDPYTNAFVSVAFAPDGHVATASVDGCLQIRERPSGRMIATLEERDDPVAACSFSPDGREVASAWEDGTIRIAERAPDACILGHHDEHVTALAFAPGAARVASGGGEQDPFLRIWDRATGRAAIQVRHPRGVLGVAFTTDGERVATVTLESVARIFDASTGALVHTLAGHRASLASCAFSPDGRVLATTSADRSVRLWDALRGECVGVLEGHRSGVTCCGFSPDGRELVTGSRDETVKIWDATEGRCRITLEGHAGGVGGCAFSPDGREVLSGAFDRTLRLWDRATGRLVRVFEGHRGPVMAVAFSPDGRLVASASQDATLCLWDRSSGHLLRTLRGHDGTVYRCAFSPDGRLLASAGHDGTLRLWELGIPASFDELLPGFADDPEGAARRLLLDLELRGRSGSPAPSDLPAFRAR
jgi:WD40 repeat protein/predicted Ser/Thr protein kinase